MQSFVAPACTLLTQSKYGELRGTAVLNVHESDTFTFMSFGHLVPIQLGAWFADTHLSTAVLKTTEAAVLS
jgi:hypothetical protein